MDVGTLFDAFISASSFVKIQQLFNQLCAVLDIDPYDSANIYKSLRLKVNDWKAKKLWSQLDRRAEQKEYCGGKACERLNVLVIGAGPCGLRSAIECALLGAHVVLVEQRDRFSRNNVLHIWPFVIQDLKNLGIKIFYPTFCRGSIDHISIRQLQCVLLKVALVLGVQVHDSVTFQGLVFPEPDEHGKVLGWHANFEPEGHILSEFVFDALIGADGKRNTVPGFPKREMRGKLAIGITANFVNRRTLEEEKVQEISGVAYIFNQQFFKDMKEATGADLENIVYYKDETHYFVMCAKKQSLLEKGVIIEDSEDVSLLLAPSNVDQEKLCEYAASAADFATDGKLPELRYALNHNGKEDVAMFDFTSLFSAQCSVRLVERYDQRLLMAIVGDTLHEPFWPTGSGCARGFLGVFDTAWMLRAYGLNTEGVMVMLAERESAYRLLAQATPDNLHKQLHKYTIDPRTRYISLEMTVQPHEVSHLVDTDNPRNVETNKPLPLRVDSNPAVSDAEFIAKYKLWRFCQQALLPYKLKMYNFTNCWEDGRPLAALLGKYRPDLVDYISLCSSCDADTMITKVMSTVEKEFGIAAPCQSSMDWVRMNEQKRVEYLTAIVGKFAEDSKRMRDLLLNAIRTTTVSHKRKAHTQQVDASRAKKSEPIQQRASELLSALASTSVVPLTVNVAGTRDRMVDDFLEGRHENLDEDQIREALAELNDDEDKRKERHAKRLKELNERTDFKKIQKKIQEENMDVKHWTKRPQVDKLNPERIYAVEKIVTGEVEAEKTRELYRNKRRQANILTRKMDKRDIDEMETKLEQTGMGVLFNREQYRVLSSKEEKIMSANAAAARQLAQDGFKPGDEKYKEIDERLSKAENLLKNQNLAGVDTVSRMRLNGTLNSTLSSEGVQLGGTLSRRMHKPPPPPTPPKRTFASSVNEADPLENGRDGDFVKLRPEWDSCGIRRRPVSMPVLETSYDSVNARRQHNCQLCSKPVYLAERMQVEGMFIHKKCFRCAFCEQPLRLGHCAQDRNLEKYNPKFYCMQHINVPVFEKIARIEKLDSRTSAKPDSPKVRVSPNASSDKMPSASIPAPRPSSPLKLNVNFDKSRSPKVMSELKELNSPAALLGKTIERMRAQREAAGLMPVDSGRVACSTPERVEFETFKRNLRADLSARKVQQRISECESASTDDEADLAVPDGEAVSACAATTSEEEDRIEEPDHEIDDEASSSDEDEFMEADLIELEKTVIENIDKSLSDSLTEEQAISLLRSFNLRRTSASLSPKRSPTTVSPSSNTSVFFTPQSSRCPLRSPSADAYYSPEGDAVTFRTPVGASPSATSVTNRPESPKSVRERTLVTLAGYREKARMKARMKSDEELGLRRAASDRMSMPVERSITSRRLRHQLSLSEHSPRSNTVQDGKQSCADQAAAKDTITPKAPTDRSLKSVHSDSDVKQGNLSPSSYNPPNRGLLARLFSPDPGRLRKQSAQLASQNVPSTAPLATDEIASTSIDSSPVSELLAANCESHKEASILVKLSSLKKLRHRKLSSTDSSEKEAETDDGTSRSNAHIPKAAVSPMLSVNSRSTDGKGDPHKRSLSQSAQKSRLATFSQADRANGSPNNGTPQSSPLSVNEKNIRRIQKRAEQIAKQKEQERVRTAQDIQRALQETDIRKAEVVAVGSDLERRLKDDNENRWVLEQWLLYVHEMEQLKLREADLLRRVSEMEIIDEYKRLQRQLNDVQKADSGIGQGGSSHTEKDLLKRMLAVIEKRDAIHQEIEKANSRRTRNSFSDPQTLLADKGASYRNFEPVFLK